MDINCGKRYIDITFDRNDSGTAYICGVEIKIIGNKVHVTFNSGSGNSYEFDKYKLHLRIDMDTEFILHNNQVKPFLSFFNFKWW